jgi:hypothetical protein
MYQEDALGLRLKTCNQTLQLLQDARELIEQRKHWTRGHLACTIFEDPTIFSSHNAYKFCALGALYKINESLPIQVGKAVFILKESARELDNRDMIYVNDILGHSAVLEVYDLAIKKAGQRIYE